MTRTIACAMLLCAAAVSPSSAWADLPSALSGWVRSAQAPIPSKVTLYQAGGEKASGQIVLAATSTNTAGAFKLSYAAPSDPNAVLYLVAEATSSSTVVLATVLGGKPTATSVTINERSTVATAFAMAQFIDGRQIGGKSPGLQNAAGTLRNLVDIASGAVGTVLASPPNGNETRTMRVFNSLANTLAGCVASTPQCAALFDAARSPAGVTPLDTLHAAINIARNPWSNSEALYAVSLPTRPYLPALDIAPTTWVLAIKYVGNGREFDGPGNMAVDGGGDVWITINYDYRKNHAVPACGGDLLGRLAPTGGDAPGAPYRGKHGGLDGAGFGITFDPEGNLWVGNFGFFGNTCPDSRKPPANSLSKFSASGAVLSPKDGYTQGCISGPQGTESDQKGNIWIANACGGTVTHYRNGDPANHWVFDVAKGVQAPANSCPAGSDSAPFDVAIDAQGNAWITDNGLNAVFKLDSTGALVKTVGGPQSGIQRPLGVAIDSFGNVWVANSRVMPVSKACVTASAAQTYGDLVPDTAGACVSQLDANGNPVRTVPCDEGSMKLPWGIAVDGNDNVWVADFAGERLTQICGAKTQHCPPGVTTGQAIAPEGYPSDALVRNTGLVIDPSGNVWVANNWLINPVQTNPGGDGLVVFIGVASPIKAPQIGPAQQP